MCCFVTNASALTMLIIDVILWLVKCLDGTVVQCMLKTLFKTNLYSQSKYNYHR